MLRTARSIVLVLCASALGILGALPATAQAPGPPQTPIEVEIGLNWAFPREVHRGAAGGVATTFLPGQPALNFMTANTLGSDYGLRMVFQSDLTGTGERTLTPFFVATPPSGDALLARAEREARRAVLEFVKGSGAGDPLLASVPGFGTPANRAAGTGALSGGPREVIAQVPGTTGIAASWTVRAGFTLLDAQGDGVMSVTSPFNLGSLTGQAPANVLVLPAQGIARNGGACTTAGLSGATATYDPAAHTFTAALGSAEAFRFALGAVPDFERLLFPNYLTVNEGQAGGIAAFLGHPLPSKQAGTVPVRSEAGGAYTVDLSGRTDLFPKDAAYYFRAERTDGSCAFYSPTTSTADLATHAPPATTGGGGNAPPAEDGGFPLLPVIAVGVPVLVGLEELLRRTLTRKPGADAAAPPPRTVPVPAPKDPCAAQRAALEEAVAELREAHLSAMDAGAEWGWPEDAANPELQLAHTLAMSPKDAAAEKEWQDAVVAREEAMRRVEEAERALAACEGRAPNINWFNLAPFLRDPKGKNTFDPSPTAAGEEGPGGEVPM